MTLRTLCLVRSAFLFLRWKFKLVPGTGDSLVPGTKRDMARLCEPCHYVGAQKRTRSHGRDPGIRCIGCPSSPGAKHASLFWARKRKWPAYASHVFELVPRRGSVTQARPRHPLHRMLFESWREACFAFLGTKKGMARLREPCLCTGAQKRTRTSTPCGTRT